MKQAFNPVLPGWEYNPDCVQGQPRLVVPGTPGSEAIPAGKQALYFTYCGSGNLDWRCLILE